MSTTFEVLHCFSFQKMQREMRRTPFDCLIFTKLLSRVIQSLDQKEFEIQLKWTTPLTLRPLVPRERVLNW